MLKPSNTWKWYYDEEVDSLMLDLGHNMTFFPVFKICCLVPDAKINKLKPFTVEDANMFQLFTTAVDKLNLSSTKKTELILNAVTAFKYHKPELPKSWFFKPNLHQLTPEIGDIVDLKTEFNRDAFLIIENSGVASFCIYAGEGTFSLTENKSLSFCQGIKVMNDRFCVHLDNDSNNDGYALVC